MDVQIAITAHSPAVEYEFDPITNLLWVKRFLQTAMHYPCHLGFNCVSENKSLDCLIITPLPVQVGCKLKCRAIGMLADRTVVIPTDAITDHYAQIKQIDDLPTQLIQKIEHFFQHVEDLEETQNKKKPLYLHKEALIKSA